MAEIIKRWYYLPSHCLYVNVMPNSITFLWFVVFDLSDHIC